MYVLKALTAPGIDDTHVLVVGRHHLYDEETTTVQCAQPPPLVWWALKRHTSHFGVRLMARRSGWIDADGDAGNDNKASVTTTQLIK